MTIIPFVAFANPGRCLMLGLLFVYACCPVCSPPALALTRDELNTIAVYEQVSPSVVNITSTTVQYDFFFRPVPASGSGSGVIIKEDGTIVTNYHVIAGTDNIEVALADGTRRKGEVVGSAPDDDLAVIRIDPEGHPLQAIAVGDSSEVETGQKVLAIGNPFGLGQTLTVGTVSMLGRDIRDADRVFRNLIQTDAAINPGNSGGALINSEGELIGINAAIVSPTGTNIGIGFAVPVNRVMEVVPGLVNRWGKAVGWVLAILLLLWMLRRIYSLR